MLSLFHVVNFFLFHSFFVGTSKACVDMTGIGNSSTDYYTLSQLDQVEWIYLFFNPVVVGDFLSRETPIQSRVSLYNGAALWSVYSSYESIPLEFFGRVDLSESRRRCETTTNDSINNPNTDLFTLHRDIASMYTMYFDGLLHYTSDSMASYAEDLEAIGLETDICFDELKYELSHCDDISTPWGLAYAIYQEHKDFGLYDGFNVDGSMNREYNRIPYSDYRDMDRIYIPKNNPWKISDRYMDNWQPLLENDGLGFLFNQEHVTPHIGYTGKSLFYTNEEFCQRSKNFKKNVQLNYDYVKEIDLLLNRMANLTETAKMEIEFFDSKINLGSFFTAYIITESNGASGRGTFDLVAKQLVYIAALYEATLAVWKEKVDYDRIRPPSLIHDWLRDEIITTYAGTTVDGETYGTREIYGSDFEAYLRTMPHSEYPSGSACLCEAFATSGIELFGTDDVTDVMGDDGFVVEFGQYSSAIEPLSTPSEDISVGYKSFSEVSKRCGETRLEGGMHFTDSVPNGAQLCRDIGTEVAQKLVMIANGQSPSYIINPQDNLDSDNPRTCYPSSTNSQSQSRSKSKSSSRSKSSSE